MKTKVRHLALLLLAATALTFAAENRTTITFNEPVTVAGKTLQPGDYQIEWNGTAPVVVVTFRHGDSKVLSVPARLRTASHPYLAFTVCPESAFNRLVEIDVDHWRLRFEQDVTSGQ